MAASRTTESPPQDRFFKSQSDATSGDGKEVGATPGATRNDDDKPSGVHRQLRATGAPSRPAKESVAPGSSVLPDSTNLGSTNLGSVTPDSAAPDSAAPDSAAPDSATLDNTTPDSTTPDSTNLGSATPSSLAADGTPLRKSWEIVEEFDHEGHRYRLQRRRISSPKGSPLARREEETLELASEGMNRKQIAKRLGLAPSTVGVLLHRASIKLRARSRNELLSSYRELTEKSRTGQ